MGDSGNQLKSVLTRVRSKRFAVPWDTDHEAWPTPAKRLKRNDDRGHEDRSRRSDRGQDDSHRERHSHKQSSSRSSKGSSAGLGSSRSHSYTESRADRPAGVGSSGKRTTPGCSMPSRGLSGTWLDVQSICLRTISMLCSGNSQMNHPYQGIANLDAPALRCTLTFGYSQIKFPLTISWAKISNTRRTLTFDSWASIVDKVWSRPTWSELLWVAEILTHRVSKDQWHLISLIILH